MSSPNQLKNDAVAIWKAGIAAVNAQKLVRENVAWSKDELRLGAEMFPIPEIDRLLVVGFGKASGAMAVGFEEALADRLFDTFEVSGLVNVPDNQVVATQAITINGCRPTTENLPTEKVVEGTEKILDIVRSAGPNDIVVCLISGGGSALLENPIEPITLDELRQTTTVLNKSGASIYELNAVRRAISQVKGGRLAFESDGAPIVSLIVSDVVGDDVSVIASGPTAISNQETCPMDVLRKFDPDRSKIPPTVWQVVEASTIETLPTCFPYSLEVSNTVIGNVEMAMKAAADKGAELGYEIELGQANGNEGDAGEVGRSVADQILLRLGNNKADNKITCYITGGETTVKVCNEKGRGGRNQHLVLSAIQELISKSADELGLNSGDFCLLSAGTDGQDGNSPVAGAIVDSDWISNQLAESKVSQIKQALEDFDSHSFLAEHELTIESETETNVGDLRILLVRSS
jgi:glycerate-2-kinase